MQTKISVIVPIYNVENYLDECLTSILNQSLKELQIICINDGSTDLSRKILEHYRFKDSRIIIDKENNGYGAACNSGLEIACGEYISFIESDDFIAPQMLEEMYNLASKNNADIVKSSFFEYIDSQSGKDEYFQKINWSEQYKMPTNTVKLTDCPQLVYFHPSIWSCIYRKKFLDKNKIRFVEAKGAGWVDNPFQIQTLCLAEKILYTDEAYYFYRLNNPSSSSNIVNISNPLIEAMKYTTFYKKGK